VEQQEEAECIQPTVCIMGFVVLFYSTLLFLGKFLASDAAAVHASSYLYLFLAFGEVGFLAFCSLALGLCMFGTNKWWHLQLTICVIYCGFQCVEY
jgi:hypothetical protein